MQTSFAGGDLRLLRVELANISKACSYSNVVLITVAVDETRESRKSAPLAHVRVYEILVSGFGCVLLQRHVSTIRLQQHTCDVPMRSS